MSKKYRDRVAEFIKDVIIMKPFYFNGFRWLKIQYLSKIITKDSQHQKNFKRMYLDSLITHLKKKEFL